MRSRPLSPEFHSRNRRILADSIGTDAIAVIDTQDVLTRSGDFEYPFHPDPNFYYLTGIAEPEAVLVLVPGHASKSFQEILFLSGTSQFVADWEGSRLTPQSASKLSGIAQVYPVSDLDGILSRLLTKYQTVYLNSDESLGGRMSSPSTRRAHRLKNRAPLHLLKSALPQLGNQRTTKDPQEIALISEGVSIVHDGLAKAMAAARPGLREYELEAELTGEFVRRGAGHVFTPIVAAGPNATIIHHMRNESLIRDGDLILFDVGAEIGFYGSDVSRTIPASGHYSKRQRQVYEAVLGVQKSAIAMHKPGISLLDIDLHMQAELTSALASLGLITAAQAKGKDSVSHLRKYYAHMSHHLGLDTHDTGDPRLLLAPGMVVTCEPGLYLKKEGIGVRIEDDILITESGCDILSDAIPKETADIQTMMGSASP